MKNNPQSLLASNQPSPQISKQSPLVYYCNNYREVYYNVTRYGQGVYLIKHCKKANIEVKYFNNKVFVRAKKLTEFIALIEESLTYDFVELPIIKNEFETYYNGKSLLCVIEKKSFTCYCLSKLFSNIIYFIFIRQVPKVNNYKLFSSMESLQDYLLSNKDLAI